MDSVAKKRKKYVPKWKRFRALGDYVGACKSLKYCADVKKDPDAMFWLGFYYLHGGLTINNDYNKYVFYMRCASEAGHQLAYFLRYKHSDADVLKTLNEPFVVGMLNWYPNDYIRVFGDATSKLALQSFLQSDQEDLYVQYMIGLCYRFGNGVKKDAEYTTKWMRKSANGGFMLAQKFLWNNMFFEQGLIERSIWFRKWYSQMPGENHIPMEYRPFILRDNCRKAILTLLAIHKYRHKQVFKNIFFTRDVVLIICKILWETRIYNIWEY